MTKSRDIANSTSTLDVDGGTIKLDGNYPNGVNNVALGNTALDTASGSNGYSVAIGTNALTAMTSGGSNVAVGYASGAAITTGGNNIAVGSEALDATTTGNSNVAMGSAALGANTTASSNVAVGHQALNANTTAPNNTAVGYRASHDNTTGTRNVSMGVDAMYQTTTGNDLVGIGAEALTRNTTGSNNVAIGKEALSRNTTASSNTAVGYQAGYTNTTSAGNTYIGNYAGQGTTGAANTFVGSGSGYLVTSGAKNTIIGQYNGNQGNLDIRTSSNNIVLSDGDGNPRVSVNSIGEVSSNGTNVSAVTYRGKNTNGSYESVGIMSDISRTSTGGTYYHFAAYDRAGSAYKFQVHDDGDVVNVNNSYGALSDVKLKENIVDSSSQWDDIKALTVRKYSMKTDNLDAPNMLGVIAQEVEAAGMSGLIKETVDRDGEGALLDTSTKQVNYSILYMKAVKALQEAMTRIETLETKVTALEA